jgi:hypothetical protein
VRRSEPRSSRRLVRLPRVQLPTSRRSSGDAARCRQDLNPGSAGGPLVGAWHEGCAPPFTRVFISLSSERDAIRAGSCAFTSSSSDACWAADRSRRRSPRRPPDIVAGCARRGRSPRRPRPSSGGNRGARARAGRRWGASSAWNRPRCWPSTRCPTPTRRCGGLGSRSMTLTSSRLGPGSSARPGCWPCGGCRCCGVSANQPWLTCVSFARPGPVSCAQRAHVAHHRTARRLRHGPLAAGRRARRAHRGGAAQRPPAGTGARVDPPGPRPADRHSTSTGSPSPTPTGPSAQTSSSTPPASPPAATTSSTTAPPLPAASASNQDRPLGPPTPPGARPPRIPTVVPNPQTRDPHRAGCRATFPRSSRQRDDSPADRPLQGSLERQPSAAVSK